MKINKKILLISVLVASLVANVLLFVQVSQYKKSSQELIKNIEVIDNQLQEIKFFNESIKNLRKEG